MSVGVLELKYWNWRLLSQGLINIERDHYWSEVEMMEEREAGTGRNNKVYHRSISQGGNNGKRSFRASYFSVESFMVLVCLTASLLILPVILPPLPPPPFMLLLLPIAILLVLMILAFMPSDIRDIASSFV